MQGEEASGPCHGGALPSPPVPLTPGFGLLASRTGTHSLWSCERLENGPWHGSHRTPYKANKDKDLPSQPPGVALPAPGTKDRSPESAAVTAKPEGPSRAHVLPETSRCDLAWNRGRCRCN